MSPVIIFFSLAAILLYLLQEAFNLLVYFYFLFLDSFQISPFFHDIDYFGFFFRINIKGDIQVVVVLAYLIKRNHARKSCLFFPAFVSVNKLLDVGSRKPV